MDAVLAAIPTGPLCKMHFLETPDFLNLLQIGHFHHLQWEGRADGQRIFLIF
jgi:hypothetical protein